MQKQSVFSRWREYARLQDEQMTPRRKKFNQVGITLLLVWTLFTIGSACVCMGYDFDTLWWVSLLCFLAAVSGVVVFIVLKRKIDCAEAVDELERLSYLFKEAHLSGDEQLEIEGLEEDGVNFLVNKDGVRVKLREGEEQVFDDGMDDGKFYCWDDLELYLAESNEFFRINLGLAIASKRPIVFVDGEEEIDDSDDIFYILPMCPNLALALRAFCWERLSLDWMYVFYQPLDSFLQIMRRGRIEKFKDRITREELTEEYVQAHTPQDSDEHSAQENQE